MLYEQSKWILFFFLYCFAGWIWECCYVAFTEKHWENRGFLHGPCLPIYGTGAFLILKLTIPIREDLVMVFLLGMISSTLLEYVTGAAMERIFHVRYWDYSSYKFNLNGHICLLASLAWGGFSIILVHFIHPIVERLVLIIPPFKAGHLSLVLTLIFIFDVIGSLQKALDLKYVRSKIRLLFEHESDPVCEQGEPVTETE